VRLQKIVEKQAEHGFAATWLSSGLIGRSLTKRPTMTVAYGSRVYGWSSQISEWLLGERATHHFIVPPTEPGERPLSLVGAAAGWMATVMMEAMGDKIRGPLAAMDWMQKCAMMVAREERPIEWTVPLTGWRVRQAYYQTEDRRVKTVLAGNVVKPVVSEETDDLDIVRQRNAIAPNVVHSLDAACLMLAVDQAAAEGVSAFGLIHDSYATHAANMDVLARAARSAFVRLYTEPVLDRLREQFATQTAEELPPVPPMGDLDLGQVHASTFFFA
jgi:DNA-directed RNA polymerase